MSFMFCRLQLVKEMIKRKDSHETISMIIEFIECDTDIY